MRTFPSVHFVDVDEIARDIVTKGEGTFSLAGDLVPDRGYMVGGCSFAAVTKVDRMTLSHVHRFIRAHEDMLVEENMFLGAWTHEGSVYLDVSQWTSSFNLARSMGRVRGELAIWNLAEGVEIRL